MPRASKPFTLELAVLGVLDRTPMHGYNLCKAIQQLDGFDMIWKIKQSALYALVEKLEARGLLESDRVPGGTHPSRKVLRVTPAGRMALDAWMDSPVESVRHMRQDFFGRLYFARLSGPERARRLLQGQRKACEGWLDNIQGKLALENGEHLQLVLSHRLQIVKATLAWLDAAERTIAAPGVASSKS